MGKKNITITLFDHNTHPVWADSYQSVHAAKNKTNGAYTYSIDIVKYHIPIILDLLANQKKYKNIIITTVGSNNYEIIPKKTDLIISYLHENIDREIPRIEEFIKNYKKKVIYITARLDLYEKIISMGIDAIHLPMAIVVSDIDKFEGKFQKYYGKRVIWFGNKYLGKDAMFGKVKSTFIRKGWQFDEISKNKFNNRIKLNRDNIFEILSHYQYGVGVGRCFLEVTALGIKTMICAQKNGGIITNNEEFELHKAHNFAASSPICTYSPLIEDCIDGISKSIIKTVDVHEILPYLEKQLKDILE